MIDDSTSVETAQIPCIGDIPFLGWLFKTVGKGREKTNLFIFITPHIVRNQNEAAAIYQKKLDEVGNVEEGIIRMNEKKTFQKPQTDRKEVTGRHACSGTASQRTVAAEGPSDASVAAAPGYAPTGLDARLEALGVPADVLPRCAGLPGKRRRDGRAADPEARPSRGGAAQGRQRRVLHPLLGGAPHGPHGHRVHRPRLDPVPEEAEDGPPRDAAGVRRGAQRPANFQAVDDLCRLLGRTDRPIVLATQEAIQAAINLAYDLSRSTAKEFFQEMHDESTDSLISEIEETGDLLDETSDAPIIKLVNLLLSGATKDRASDIHIEPYQTIVKVRYRIDGILYDILSLPRKIHSPLASRVKIMAKLNIAENGSPRTAGSRSRSPTGASTSASPPSRRPSASGWSSGSSTRRRRS